jgi:raffinose/stachyose/melibiose transport system permease protein
MSTTSSKTEAAKAGTTGTTGSAGSAGSAGDSAGPARRLPSRDSRYASWWWAVPAVALVIAIHYAAITAGSIYAFTDYKGVGKFNFIGMGNFVKIFSGGASLKALINTLIIAFVFLIATNGIGLAFALALNRTLRSRHFLRVILFAPVVLSPLAVSYIWKFIYQQKGPLNEFLGSIGLESWQHTWLGDPSVVLFSILLVMVWQNVGLTMVIFLAGLANVPEDLEEAAAIDGAGVWTRFTKITLPLLRPTIVVASTLILIQGLRVFDQVQALTGGGPFGASETLATQVYKETFVNGRYGYGAALSLVMTVLILFFALLQMGLLRGKKDD